MVNHNKRYNFIFERTSVVRNHDIEILEETDIGGGKAKIAARAALQESEVRNRNNRYYSSAICESIVNQLAPKAQGRSLLMEVDHPLFVSPDPEVLKKRASIIEINNCGALIREIGFKNKQIYGIFETLSGFKGPDLYNLITKDKVDIGFSLRALGAVETLQDGTIMVKDPIRPITYDIVSNPSHANAKVLEFLPESANEFIPDNSTMICEGEMLDILGKDRIVVSEGDSMIIRFIDDIINERFETVVSKGIKFKIY
ncbi:MAG TPA: hypothetical protein PLL26_04725 [Candidatus Dojkabacteria bacterium]|nr:hypothetical protein [Candidatus Dojkabacteria bacterium]